MSSTRAGTPAAPRSLVVALGLLLPLLATLLGAGPAAADTTTVPGLLTTSSTPARPGTADTLGSAGAVSGPTLTLSAGPVPVPVPAGVTPSAVTGVLTMPEVAPGATILLLVNGREALSVASTLYTRISVPVTAADVVADGTIGLSLRYVAAPGSTTCTDAPGVTVRKLGLTYTGTETPPDSVATFFPAAVSRVDVRVPADASDDLLQAGLNAVAAISHRYQGETPVVLGSADEPLPAAGAGQRLVSIEGGASEVTAAVGTTPAAEPTGAAVPTLTLTGSGLPLSAAARGLGGAELSLASGAETEGLTRQVESRDDGRTRTVDQLRTDLATPDGAEAPPPPGTWALPVRQDSWGRTVEGYRLHLEGTHSAVPAGAEARLDVYVDDELIGSQLLDEDPRLDLDVDVPAAAMATTNQLRATIVSSEAPASLCAPGLPLDLDVDEESSTVTARPGNGVLRGFGLLPQAFGGRLQVALRQDGAPRLDDAIDAAALVSAMQRVAAAPFDVTIVDPDVLIGSGDSGIVVGAGPDDAQALGTPLQLSGDRSLDISDTAFEVASTEPFAALEVVAQRGRYVLMLGSWQPGGVQADPALSHRLTTAVTVDGWAGLEGDVMVADGSGDPVTVDSGTPATEPAADDAEDDGGTAYLGWFALVIGLLLALLALQVVRALRRDRRARERAQAAAAADEASDASDPDVSPTSPQQPPLP